MYSPYNVLFFFHSALSVCFLITTGKNIDKRRLTSIFTCELNAMYEAQAVVFYSDLS